MTDQQSNTGELLSRWRKGDERAFDTLLEQNESWILAQARLRLGAKLRLKEESADIVQEALLRFLRFGPRFIIQSSRDFRGLMARIVENVVRDRVDYFSAQRRNSLRERAFGSESVIALDEPYDSARSPSADIAQEEEVNYVLLGIEFLNSTERCLIELRYWKETLFAEIGRQLDLSESAARMRHQRAMKHLDRNVRILKQGQIRKLLLENSRSGQEKDSPKDTPDSDPGLRKKV